MVLFDKFTIDVGMIIKPIISIAIGFIIYEIIKKIIKNTEKSTKLKKQHHKKRINTINNLILNIVKYIIIIFVIIAVLANFGVNVKSILAGVGITAAIIGLAFQDIAKDFLAGISIVLEDQFEIGDTIEINGFRGEVVAFGLRTTRVKNYKGATKIIANHMINEVTNYNLYNNLAVAEVSVGYDEDLNHVEEVINNLSKTIKNNIPKAKSDIKILGIKELEESGIIYKVGIEVPPAEELSSECILRKLLKESLTEANIKIPYKQVEVHHGTE